MRIAPVMSYSFGKAKPAKKLVADENLRVEATYDAKEKCFVKTTLRSDGTKATVVKDYVDNPQKNKVYEVYDVKGRLMARSSVIMFNSFRHEEMFDTKTGKKTLDTWH